MMEENKVPLHVSMIMDGNGRWARLKGKERIEGHREGVESVRACTEYAIEKGIGYLSLFAFSEENWGRPDSEVSFLMELMVKAMVAELPSFMENGIRFRVLGNRERLTQELKDVIDDCMERTASNSRLNLIVFLSYSGKWDILQAAKRFAADMLADSAGPERLNDTGIGDFEKYLVTAGIPDPDLIVRTSGEKRMSNYLLWQGAYSEFYFTDVLWPDFRKGEFQKALDSYALRERRYGKVFK